MSSFFDASNVWIQEHQALVVAVGIPILTTVVAGLLSLITNRSTLSAQKRQRFLEKEIKMAEFRQVWINDLRVSFAKFASLDTKVHFDATQPDLIEMVEVGSLILMRMNRQDPDYEQVARNVERAIDRTTSAGRDSPSILEKYKDVEPIVIVAQRILKREWERLKHDLARIER